MKKISRVTINDIAKHLNVSANTVSKALNGKPKISEGLRAEIIKVASNMGYEKNINASRLSQKNIHLGVLINGYDENYYSYTQRGFKKALEFLADRRVDITVKTIKANNDNTEALQILEEFLYGGFDGVIINDLHTTALLPVLERYRKAGIKYALLNYDFPETKRSFSMINDYSCAAKLAADVLSISVKADQTLAVFSHFNLNGPQKSLADLFSQQAKASGICNIKVTNDLEELFTFNNLGGIYVSHASYLTVCQKIEELYAEKEKPRVVVSDLYEQGVQYIENNTITAVIYQNPEEQAFLTAVSLYELVGENKKCADILTVDPLIIMKSNYKKYL